MWPGTPVACANELSVRTPALKTGSWLLQAKPYSKKATPQGSKKVSSIV